MKNIALYTLLAAVLSLTSCQEEPPGINFNKPIETFGDTSYVTPTVEPAQPKMVVIEDFTGVRCSNCPKGHEVMKELKDSFPSRVAPISIHGYDFFQFTSPFAGYEDFRDSAGGQIMNIIGKPSGLPYGAIDRTFKSGVAAEWRTYFKTRMAQPTKVNLYLLDKSYNSSTRELSVMMKAAFTDSLGDEPYFSVAIVENGIISLQKDEDLAATPKNGFDTTYVHNRLMRKMPFFHEKLKLNDSNDIVKGRVIERGFKYTLKPGWNADNCYLVFYVHREIEILHATEIKIK